MANKRVRVAMVGAVMSAAWVLLLVADPSVHSMWAYCMGHGSTNNPFNPSELSAVLPWYHRAIAGLVFSVLYPFFSPVALCLTVASGLALAFAYDGRALLTGMLAIFHGLTDPPDRRWRPRI